MVYLIDITGNIGALETALQQAHDKLIAHVSDLTGISLAIAGFGALWTVGSKILPQIQKGKSPDFEVLNRPIVIGFAISFFPYLLSMINSVMQPTVTGTAALAGNANQTVATLLQQKEEILQKSADWQMYTGTTGNGSLDKWEELSGEADSNMFSGISNRVKFEMAKASYNMKNSVRVWLSQILEIAFESAGLCLNTIRTFCLVILGLLGPFALAFSTYRGLEGSISHWFSHYLHVFFWLPVANIFGALISQIQQEMIKLDIAQVTATGQTTFGPTDAAYIIFLLMAIAGYLSVPKVTNYIIRSGGITPNFSPIKLFKTS